MKLCKDCKYFINLRKPECRAIYFIDPVNGGHTYAKCAEVRKEMENSNILFLRREGISYSSMMFCGYAGRLWEPKNETV